MRRFKPLRPALLGLACIAVALPARAGMLPADALPLPNRVAKADLIVVGKVASFEDKTVVQGKTEYKIAVVTVSDPLLAPKGARTIRLGFVPIPPRLMIRPRPFEATAGQEGCYFLTRLGGADFHVPAGPLSFLDKKSASFDKDVALIKRCVKLLQDPDASLKSKNAEDRFLTAGMLVARYTTRKTPTARTEPIEAEQSKRILQALASADWTPATDLTRLSPLMVLHRLPLTAKDGWSPPAPRDAKTYAAYAQKWVKEHAETYRIQRFVAEKDK